MILRALACLLSLVAGGCSVLWAEVDPRPPYLRRYIEEHYAELGTSFVAPMAREELAAQLSQTRLLLLGDHHRDPRHHAHVLALLRWIQTEGLRPVVGVESVGSEDNVHLQEYLDGTIDLWTLRERIAHRWPESWLEDGDVDAGFYRELLRTCREGKIAAFPLEPTPRRPLEERDALITRSVRRAMRLYPDRLIVVVVGHAHLLGPGHLSGRLDVPTLHIGARLSSTLNRALADAPQADAGDLLRTDRGVLFFPATPVEDDSFAER